jgi:hypothetical protein
MTALAPYDADFYAWATQQADLLRSGRLSEADVANIAEEIDSMGRSERRELISRLDVLLTLLLKWQFQPAFRGTSWQLTIREQRRKLLRHLRDNPSLRVALDATIAEAYGDALLSAQRETGLAEENFPAICPYSAADLFSEGFFPD